MDQDFITKTASEIAELKQLRETYSKRFWIHSKSMNQEKRKHIKKLFRKIDRLRNHLMLWLKHLVSKKPSDYDNYVGLINKGKAEIQTSFKQLDEALYSVS